MVPGKETRTLKGDYPVSHIRFVKHRDIPAACLYLATETDVPRTYLRCFTCHEPFDHRFQWKAQGYKFVIAVTADGATRACVWQCPVCFVPQRHQALH